MDYNKLKTFLLVAEHGGLARAARALHRTPSAVSQQLKSLEEELGFALFMRGSRNLSPTREGRALRGPARAALEQVDDAVSALRQKPGTSRCLRIGCVAELLAISLAPLLGPLRVAHPDLDLDVIVATSAEIEAALLADELDLGVLVTFREGRRFERTPFATVRCGVVASPQYLRRAGPLRTMKQIAAADVVDVSRSGAWFATWLGKNDAGARASFAGRRPAIVVPSHEGIRQACLGGGGVGLVPLSCVSADLDAGRLHELIPNAKPVTVGAELAVLRREAARPAVSAFLAFVRSRAGAGQRARSASSVTPPAAATTGKSIVVAPTATTRAAPSTRTAPRPVPRGAVSVSVRGTPGATRHTTRK
jgi:DNA-binding transcriptional LysR family regulator